MKVKTIFPKEATFCVEVSGGHYKTEGIVASVC